MLILGLVLINELLLNFLNLVPVDGGGFIIQSFFSMMKAQLGMYPLSVIRLCPISSVNIKVCLLHCQLLFHI